MKFLLGALYSVVYFLAGATIGSNWQQLARSPGKRAFALMTLSSVFFGLAGGAMGLAISSYWVLSSYDRHLLPVVVRAHIVGGLIVGLCNFWYIRLVFKCRDRLWTMASERPDRPPATAPESLPSSPV